MTVIAPRSRTAWLWDGYRRRTSPFDALVLAASIALVSLLVKLAWPRFTFWGDNAESFFPLWHMYGESIRNGAPELFRYDGWGGGNVVAEAAYGVFNPVVIVNSMLISLTDRLSLASFLVMTEFLCLFGVGVYLLARSYGANRAAAFTVGMIMPFAGYTVYYEAGNWASGLMSITWVCWFWWGAHEFAQARRGPLAPIVTGYLAATVGSPYAVLGILVVLLGLAVHQVVDGRWRRLGLLVIMGATIGLVVVAVYIPLLAALPDTVRNTAGAILNKNYLTPGLGDFLGMSSPSFLPRMNAWNSRWDAVPSTYLSWIILPLLPWLRWRVAFVRTGLLSVFISGGLFLLLTLGPQNLWLFQWPIRLVEFTYVAVLVVLALVLSKGIATDRQWLRAILSASAVAVAFFVAWSSKPDLWAWHFAFTGITTLGMVAAIVGARRFGTRAITAIAIIGTAAVAPLQTQIFAWDRQMITAELNQQVPTSLETLRAQAAGWRGTVLQLASLEVLGDTDAVPTGTLSFANNRTSAGFDTVNRYTGIGFNAFSLASGMDYRGSTPWGEPISRFFETVPGYDVPLIEAMGVDTLVVNPRIPGFDTLGDVAEGWTLLEASLNRTVLRAPWDEQDTVVTSGGLEVTDVALDGATATIRVAAGSGSMLLPRVAWRGYSARSGDTELTVRTGPAGLLEVEVPPGVAEVTVSYEIPGIRVVIALGVAVVVATVLQQLMWRRGVRRPPGRVRLAPDRVERANPDTLDRGAQALHPVLTGAHPPHERP